MKYWNKAWSLVDGCTPVSPACDNCWLAQMGNRFEPKRLKKQCRDCIDYGIIPIQCNDLTCAGHFTGTVRIREDRLNIPMKIKKPTIFAIWSDLFHPSVPADFIIEAFERMKYCGQHTFLVLTKRPERMESVLYGPEGNFYLLLGSRHYMPNVWLGVTVENQKMVDERIPYLLQCQPFKLFLSVEPLLGKIDISGWLTQCDLKTRIISQVICGGETGHNARPMHPDWVRCLRNQCMAAEVPFFFKGWGAWQPVEHTEGIRQGDICLSEDGVCDVWKKGMVCFANESDGEHMRRVRKPGRLLDGREWNELAWGRTHPVGSF